MVMIVVVTFSWPKTQTVINCNKLRRQLCFYKLGKGANRRECVKQKIMEHSVKRETEGLFNFPRYTVKTHIEEQMD